MRGFVRAWSCESIKLFMNETKPASEIADVVQ